MIHSLPSPYFTVEGPDFFVSLFLYFCIFSIIGWLVEMGYLATAGRGLVNSGFLQGPFCPAYAAGAVIIYPFTILFGSQPFWLQVILYVLLATVIEYVAHYSLEKILGIRIWDYSDEFLNLHGRISLKYTFFWLLLVLILVLLVQPFIVFFIESIPETPRIVTTILFAIVLTTDYIFSAIIFKKMKNRVQRLCELNSLDYTRMQDLQFNRPRVMNEKKRLAKLFAHPQYSSMTRLVESVLFAERCVPSDSCSSPALFSEIPSVEFKRLTEKPLYEQWRAMNQDNRRISMEFYRIAELSALFCQQLDLDVSTAVRGVLKAPYHSRSVSGLLRLADFLFPQRRVLRTVVRDLGSVTKIEKDIILHYTWPLNLSLPRTPECLCVSFAEKLVHSREFRRELASLYHLPVVPSEVV